MEDYKPNSHAYKEKQKAAEKQKLEKVVKGTVKTKKKNGIHKFTDAFVSDDAKNVKSYVIFDVIVPTAKKLISEVVTNVIDILLYGEAGHSKKRSDASRISYRSYYDKRDDERRNVTRTRTGYSYDDVILESRGEAEEVLARMDEAIDLYGTVSVADLYDLVGITGEYTDNKYGWTNIRNAEVVRTRDGDYMIKLPKALPLV